MLAGETFSVDPVGDGTPQGRETQEANHLAQEAQVEANSQDHLNQGGSDPNASTTASTPSTPSAESTTPQSTSYEDRVKVANGDPTVGEANSHQWNGSQPVTDANGNPVDKGWAGPDAVRNYGEPDETWIEAKSNVEGEPDFMMKTNARGQTRNFSQLGRYFISGRPFEYWVDAEPASFTREVIESWGGIIVVFP